MIKKITVINHIGQSIVLELRRPEKSGFLVREVTGLGPSKANINMTELATIDGSLFTSSRLISRNIVLDLKFLYKPSIEEVRLMSYKYFPIKKRIKLQIETDKRTCEIYGYVESNEPNIFSKNESTQISIVCPDPYFYAPENQVTLFAGIEPLFEFEFSNESLDTNEIAMGNIVNRTEGTVYYEGDAEVGVVITMHFLGEATNITIYNNNTRQSMFINSARILEIMGSHLKAGDDIIISTIKGNKYISLLRDGLYTNLLNCLDKDTDWFYLVKGDNVFFYTADTGLSNLTFKIENQVLYEGV